VPNGIDPARATESVATDVLSRVLRSNDISETDRYHKLKPNQL
jgi:hypothetical protein